MKVGEYVRTKYGEICKLKKSRFKDLVYETDIEIDRYNDRDSNDYGFDSNTIQDIIKSSPNIIDLIEVGDYVNGHRVNYINKNREHFNISFGNEDFNLKSKFNSDIYWLSKEDIKSIVTKEAFESMEYRIGE